MPLLAVPPAEVVTENPQWSPFIRNEFHVQRAAVLSSLGALPLPQNDYSPLKTQYFFWKGDRNVVLHGLVVLKPGSPEVLFTAHTMVSHDSCLCMGTRFHWAAGANPSEKEFENKNANSIGTGPKNKDSWEKKKFPQVPNPNAISPVGLDIGVLESATGRWSKILSVLSLTPFLERGIPLSTPLSKLHCHGYFPVKAFSPKVTALSRPHFVFKAQLKIKESKPLNFSLITSSVLSGVFATVVGTSDQNKASPVLNLGNWPQWLWDNVGPWMSDLKDNRVQVLKRQGRWAYLNRGRAHGLKIGDRLVTAGGGEMHIIHYSLPTAQVPDGAVALVREEGAGGRTITEGTVCSYP